MSDDKEIVRKIKYCVHCGTEASDSEIYCSKCGKLVAKLTKPQSKKPPSISRKCSECGSIINSPILEQCPICNNKLEKVLKQPKTTSEEKSQKKTGVIFTNKKFVAEQRLSVKKDAWTIREGISIFSNSLMVYVVLRFLIIIMILTLTGSSETVETTMPILLLEQIPTIIFGVYPMLYIYSKKHDFKKMGFYLGKNKIFITFLIGIVGAACLIMIDFSSGFLIDFIYDIGINVYDIKTYIIEENQIIRNAGIIWMIPLIILLCLGTISTEIVYRGVLHNALKQYFNDKFTGRITIILTVSLVYSGLMFFFTFPGGIYFILINFLVFTALGIMYEINGNLFNTIIAGIIYDVLIVLIIYFNITLFP
ncbi:MAG: zinc-ribbon domain-containing protein [Promethearchaeota archaeon]